MRKVPRRNTILCALKIYVICPDYDDRFINYMNHNWLKDSPKIGLHKASNRPITVCLLNSFFAFQCRFLFPSEPKRYLKLVSLLNRKRAPSRNVFCTETSVQSEWHGLVTEISFCKTPVVDEKRLVFRG